MHHRRGRHDWGPLQRVAHHPASRLLQSYKAQGVPCTLADSPWTVSEQLASLHRGPHQSAYQHISFLRDDMADMSAKGFWMVIPFSDVASSPHLRLSPIGVVPQRARRPRPIVDYTFFGVNAVTQPNAAFDSMQFGRAFERLLRKIVLANPRYGPIYLSKVDLADGYYRLYLTPRASLNLAVTFPSLPGEPPLVAIPLALPMGWTNSPPLFCTATETIADVTNQRLLRRHHEHTHRLDDIANSIPTTTLPLPPSAPCAVPIPLHRNTTLDNPTRRRLNYVDVYVDDFLAVAQGPDEHLQHVRRTLFHTIDDVFRPLDDHDHPARKDPISVKKLLEGDACWSTSKTILGWHIDTTNMTVTLTEPKRLRLLEILDLFPPSRTRCSRRSYQQLLGELRYMSVALPGSRHLFSILHAALTAPRRIRLTAAIHATLADFRTLCHQLPSRPTRLYELVPLSPTLRGTHDAAGTGMGGVWLPSPSAIPRGATMEHQLHPAPVVWRATFPPDITASLVSHDNPRGSVTNSDLELAGSIMHHECAAHTFDVRERTLLSATDNVATLYWQRKASARSPHIPASLLRIQGHHQRLHRYLPLHDYIPGVANAAADAASPPILATLAPDSRDAFHLDLRAAQDAVAAGVHASHSASANGHWAIWTTFCNNLGIPPLLEDVPDATLFLQVFAHRYRNGTIAAHRRPVRARTVEGALRSVGQTFSAMGAADPRLTPQGTLDFRLARQLRSYSKLDPPPDRVKPVPVTVLQHIMWAAVAAASVANLAIADMICLAFFFLLRPGEYTFSTSESTPFTLGDVQLFVGLTRLDLDTASDNDLRSATFASLTFTTQKNGVRGEVVGHSRSGNPQFCPVLSIVRRVLHLRAHHALPTTPLASFHATAWSAVTPADISSTLRTAVTALGPQALGFTASDVSARCLRAAGAMALLCAHVDSDVIRLLGRWRSDEMLRYLHLQAEPVMRDFSSRMLTGGHFVLHPNADVPQH